MNYTSVFSFLLLMVFVAVLYAEEHNPQQSNTKMKQYYFVMLTKGSNRSQDSASVVQIQKGHMDNMKRLADEGKLIVAGPFLDDGFWRGIFIFDMTDKTAVEELLQSDPAISTGRLSYEIHPWMTQKGTIFK
jgi:uncharacterized protein